GGGRGGRGGRGRRDRARGPLGRNRETVAAAGGLDAAAHGRSGGPGRLRGAVTPRRRSSMQRKWIVIAAALAAWPAARAAQRTPPGTPRPPLPPLPPREPRGAFTYAFDDNRGRIGV